MSSKKTYAELSAELEATLSRLQHNDIDVDDALQAYQDGMKLIELLEAHLKEAENTIKKIKADFSV